MIFKVNKAIMEAIRDAGASPPICFGVIAVSSEAARFGIAREEWYIGLCDAEYMRTVMRSREQVVLRTEHVASCPTCGQRRSE